MNSANATDRTEATLFFAERAREITEFCVRRGGKCFSAWVVPTVFAYAFFHVVQRTVFCTRANSSLASAAFIWGAPEKTIRARAAAGEPVFRWERSRDGADSLFVAEVIGSQANLARLIKPVSRRWPDWERKKLFTYRQEELVQLEPATINRMIYGRR